MADAAQIKVVRIQNIPRTQSVGVFHRLLSQACGPDIQVQVHLAPSCCMHDESQVAIAKFSPRLPDFLSPLAADRVGDKECLASVGSSVCSFDKHFFGLTQLYATVEDCDITADVVAVTGLNGRPFDSWRGVDPRGQMWLQNFFAADLPSVRTMIYGYNTKWESKGIADVSDFVAQLSMELRKARRSHSQNAPRPLVLIAHSFGAIIVARLLLEWKNNSGDAFIQSAFKSVRAVFLFGAPHRGMDINDIEEMARDKSADHRMDLLRSLGFDSADKLALEAEKFVELADYFKIFSFYEVRLSQRLAKSATTERGYARTGADFYFVTKNSALLGLPPPLEHQIPIDADHSQMVKFNSRSDPTYQTVLQLIQELITGNDFKDPLRRASDTKQLNTYENPRADQIQQMAPAPTPNPDVFALPSETSRNSQVSSALPKPGNLYMEKLPKVPTEWQSPLSLDADGLTILHRSCRENNLDLVSKILVQPDGKRAMTLRDATGKVPLHHAAGNGSLEVVLQVLDLSATDHQIVWTKDYDGKTPLHYAARSGNTNVLEILVRSSHKPKEYIMTQDDDGNSALKLAAKYKKADAVALLTTLRDSDND